MEGCPKLLDLMSKRKWNVKIEEEEEDTNEETLKLSLGPPGDDNSTNIIHSIFDDKSQASFGYFCERTSLPFNSKFSRPSWSSTASILGQKESSQPAEKKTFSATNTAVPSSAHKRTAPAPVVGWPPIRSFRKNLATTSSLKSSSELPNVVPNKAAVGETPAVNNQKGLFMKINMDGIPIGRKVDLKTYDSYEKLSSVVDELFRGLLAGQSDSCENGIQKKNEGKTIICGLLDGSGEYTLVYEDNEGDRMLVGDVPWQMFVSTVRRLRVLKTSELPMLHRGSKQGKVAIEG